MVTGEKMKKKMIVGVIAVFFILLSIFLIVEKNHQKEKEDHKRAQEKVELVKDLTAPFLAEKKVSDYIEHLEGTLMDDYMIDTSKLGKQKVIFEFVDEKKSKLNYTFEIEVKDITPPFTTIGKTYSVVRGSDKNFVDKIFCGDDQDSHPKCTIEGDYDLEKSGNYPVVFKAVDKSGNVLEKEITLRVYDKGSGGSSTSNKTRTEYSDIVKNHKNGSTLIGLDVSKWQGDIDFDTLKKEGVEFIMLRIGSSRGTGGEYYEDSYFKRNIENALRVGIPVGIYFYSYANTEELAKKDAEWVIEQVKGYQVDLPIAFDWEDWSSFNSYGISFYDLTKVANAFLKTIEDAGYQGMLYSSKYYLENVWLKKNYPVWLAHYTSKTDYNGDYRIWQLCSNGKIKGIYGNVDIDILYLKENN